MRKNVSQQYELILIFLLNNNKIMAIKHSMKKMFQTIVNVDFFLFIMLCVCEILFRNEFSSRTN